jgi:hypothetical protein
MKMTEATFKAGAEAPAKEAVRGKKSHPRATSTDKLTLAM